MKNLNTKGQNYKKNQFLCLLWKLNYNRDFNVNVGGTIVPARPFFESLEEN